MRADTQNLVFVLFFAALKTLHEDTVLVIEHEKNIASQEKLAGPSGAYRDLEQGQQVVNEYAHPPQTPPLVQPQSKERFGSASPSYPNPDSVLNIAAQASPGIQALAASSVWRSPIRQSKALPPLPLRG